MARRADHSSDELKEMIVLSAQKIINEQGINNLSTRGIAKDIGYTAGTLYQHFKDINEILLNVHARSLKALIIEMETCFFQNDPKKMIAEYADIYINFIEDNKKAWNAIFAYQRPENFEIPRWYREYIDKLISFVASCFKRIEDKQSKSSPEEAAQMVWASVHSVCSLESSGRLGIIMEKPLKPLIHDLVKLHIAAY